MKGDKAKIPHKKGIYYLLNNLKITIISCINFSKNNNNDKQT